MTRSRLRKLRRAQSIGGGALFKMMPVASALLACMPAAHAADTSDVATLEEVVVTAQKRTENLQDVPISIQALRARRSSKSCTSTISMTMPSIFPVYRSKRSVARASSTPIFAASSSGGDGNHSGSQPSVGMYLDEQPVTTIDGNLDIHIYDIERVEALTARRAPSTGRARSRARSASSPTSPTRAASRPAMI